MLLAIIWNMFAVISWNTKISVTLDREELEVQSSAKYVMMNGGKQEVGQLLVCFSGKTSGEASFSQFMVTALIVFK